MTHGGAVCVVVSLSGAICYRSLFFPVPSVVKFVLKELATTEARSTRRRLRTRFKMSTKLLSHGGQNLFSEGVFLPRAKPRIQCRAQHLSRYSFLNRCLNRPAPFAGILNKAAVVHEISVLKQGHRGQIEQPGRNPLAPPQDSAVAATVQS